MFSFPFILCLLAALAAAQLCTDGADAACPDALPWAVGACNATLRCTSVHAADCLDASFVAANADACSALAGQRVCARRLGVPELSHMQIPELPLPPDPESPPDLPLPEDSLGPPQPPPFPVPYANRQYALAQDSAGLAAHFNVTFARPSWLVRVVLADADDFALTHEQARDICDAEPACMQRYATLRDAAGLTLRSTSGGVERRVLNVSAAPVSLSNTRYVHVGTGPVTSARVVAAAGTHLVAVDVLEDAECPKPVALGRATRMPPPPSTSKTDLTWLYITLAVLAVLSVVGVALWGIFSGRGGR